MGLRPTQGNEKRLGPASALYGTVTLSLSSRPKRSGAEGPAVPRTLRGDVFRPERTRISCHAALDRAACAPFFKERRMMFADATNFYRKSGVAQWRDPRFLFRQH
jgi:hypothetical protein